MTFRLIAFLTALALSALVAQGEARGQAPGTTDALIRAKIDQLLRAKSEANWPAALQACQELLPLTRQRFGPDHPNTGRVAEEFTAALTRTLEKYQGEAEFGRAYRIASQAATFVAAQYPAGHPLAAARRNQVYTVFEACRSALAGYEKEGNVDRAAAVCQDVLVASAHSADPATQRFRVVFLNKLGLYFFQRDDYANAERQYAAADAILDKLEPLPEDGEVRGLLAINLGRVYEVMGQFDQAERQYRGAEAVTPEGRVRAHALNCRGWLCHLQARGGLAKGLYEEALRLFEAARALRAGDKAVYATPEERDRELAEVANNLGLTHMALEDFAAAEKELKRSLQGYTAALGTEHPRLATPLLNLGRLHLDRGEYDRAGERMRQSLDLLTRAKGEADPDAAAVRLSLAWLELARGDLTKAADHAEQARRDQRAYARRVLAAQSEREQLAYLRNRDHMWFHVALSLGWRAAQKGDHAVVARSAEWLLNGEGLTQEVLGERYRLQRACRELAGSADELAELHELEATRKELVRRSLQTQADPVTGGGRRPVELQALNDREIALSRQLAQRLGSEGGSDQWTTLAAVREALDVPRPAVLIDVVRLKEADFTTRGTDWHFTAPRYVAWVIPPRGRDFRVRVVDLGPADVIDRAVAALREEVNRALPGDGRKTVLEQRGPRAAESELLGPLGELSRLLLDPLRPHIGGYERWVFRPDGPLWLVPWTALRVGDQYAVEGHVISCVVRGRDLVPPAPPPPRPPGSLVFAGLEYGGAASPLPSSLLEGEVLAKHLRDLDPAGTVSVHSGERGTKARFLDGPAPRVLVLSTHALFRRDGVAARLLNPMLRCEILFSRDGPGAADMRVNGTEVVARDLRGTELVLLSACETGLGELHDVAEGPATLASAFHLAGARSVIASLWSVPDRDTAVITTDCFKYLVRGDDIALALCKAQRDWIRANRDDPAQRAAYPVQWAGLTLTGPPLRLKRD